MKNLKNPPLYDYNGKADCIYSEAEISGSPVIVVLDDDPTGIQTVHDVNVYTDWQKETIVRAFETEEKIFFIMTNSRSFLPEQTEKVHKDIAVRLKEASEITGRKFIIVSRGDSTLRGHWPLETKTLAENCEIRFDGEILIPFFAEGGRYTFGDVHYVRKGNDLIPAGETEFAKDRTFAFQSSDLKEYVCEKTKGAVSPDKVISVPLEKLNACDTENVLNALLKAENGTKIIVNAVSYDDLKVFYGCYAKAVNAGKRFIFRTAASWVKIISKCPDRPLLTHDELSLKTHNGGLVVVGSHVAKTTAQLEKLKESGVKMEYVMFDVNFHSDPNAEAERISAMISELIRSGRNVCVYTSRQVTGPSDPAKSLEFSVSVSHAVTSIVANLSAKPAFIVAKGGITSSDIGTKALGVRKAVCAGQIAPGIPVWMTDDCSLFGKMPYVIFPGNVGEENTLAEVVEKLVGR